ncbi:MAG: indole-3-glycerol-phosphate synthase [Actinomycetota bacterium]|nr:indole-3-glycerol-phosphate synthase [Actinomycetota bacterium]
MAATYLDSIESFHRKRAQLDDRDWRRRMAHVHYDGPRLDEALTTSAGSHVKVIAEIKRRSPSKGWLGEHLDVVAMAQEYVAGGASAISVLTDEPHFAGSRADLEAVSQTVTLPVLRKDFTVSENDVLDAAQMGASGVLLIAAILAPTELSSFVALALEVGLSPLVEVHDAREADIALSSGARLIGVNQRDLHTFHVDPERAAAVIANLPRDVIRIAESGLRSADDVRRAAQAGFDAVLVGEVFVTSPTPSATVREFANVALGPQRD